MKRLFLTYLLLMAFMGAQAADITGISQAFQRGNASALSGIMDQEVDIALPDAFQKCGGSEAIQRLAAFLDAHKPSGFSVVHQADKKESGFLIGKLPTASKEYRVNITYRVEGNKAIIQSIRIE